MAALVLGLMLGLLACDKPPRTLLVTATAYNSVPAQTNADPETAAWGDRLRPGMKAVAVSRDLLKQGLTYGTRLRIEGLSGEYTVLDKMHPRWNNKIDIYLGEDVGAALDFGEREVRIWWTPDD